MSSEGVNDDDKTQRFANTMASLKFDDLPEEVISRTKDVILDSIGTALGATSKLYDIGAILHQFADESGGTSASQVYGSPLRTTPETAALVNGTLSYFLDNECHHAEAVLHPVAVSVPASLAVADALNSSGQDFLVSVIAGIDVACRVSSALDLAALYRRGFHPSSVAGAFGATAAASWLLGLRDARLRNAYGLAAAQASGLLSWVSDDAEHARPFNIGVAARGGVTAARLAALGMHGAPAILEGKFPLGDAFSGSWSWDPMFSGLGAEFKVMDLYFKLYTCVSFTHPGLDALIDICQSESLQPEEIADIELRFPTGGYRVIDGNQLRSHCAQYLFSIAVHRGSIVFDDVLNDRRDDPSIQRLFERTTVVGDDELDRTYPEIYRSIVNVTARGQTYSKEVVYPKGSPRNPLSSDEVERKFRRVTSGVLFEDQQSHIIGAVTNLETISDIRELTDHLAVEAR